MTRQPEQVTLSGVEIIKATEKAVLIVYDEHGDSHTHWLPRSQCLDGDELGEGDKDIVVAKWIADKEGLPYE